MVGVVPRAHDISICLVGFETHKARPDAGDDSGFRLRVRVEDASPFVAAFKVRRICSMSFSLNRGWGRKYAIVDLDSEVFSSLFW